LAAPVKVAMGAPVPDHVAIATDEPVAPAAVPTAPAPVETNDEPDAATPHAPEAVADEPVARVEPEPALQDEKDSIHAV